MCSRIGCLVTITMVGFLLLASCSTAPASPVPSETSSKSTKPYGNLTVAPLFGKGALDPQREDGLTYQTLSRFALDNLVRQAPDGKIIPNLAERWEISSDGMTHTFHIRKGVKFHDGSDLTGADVKFSLERMMAPESINAKAPLWRSTVARVDLVDDYTVSLRLKAPEFELLQNAELDATPVMPKKYIEEKGADYFAKNIIGSGPFKVVRYEPGTRLELEVNENYWGAVPQFKNITLLNIPEEATKVAMLKTGELDVAKVAVDSIATVEAAGLRVMSWDAGAVVFGFFYFDVDNPGNYPVGDQRVRKALTLAMDRKEIVNKLFGGKGSPSIMYPAASSEEFFDPKVLKLDPYDPEQAKSLLAQAGFPNGFDMRVWDIAGGLPLLNQAIVGYWLRIGVKAQLEPIEYGAFSSLVMPKHNPKAWNNIWIWPSTTKRGFMGVVTAFHSVKNGQHNLKNSKLDALIEKASQSTSSDDRKRLMSEATAMAKDEYSSIGIVNLYENLALSSKVGEATPYWGRDIVSMIATMSHPK